jgi:hypothetical protein
MRISQPLHSLSGIMMLMILAFSVPAGFAAVSPGQLRLDVALNQPIMTTGETQNAYLYVGLTGFKLTREAERPSVNITIMIDKSGSMSGEKVEKAKDAAIQALSRLRSDEIVSVVTYDSTVHVLVPATKLSDRDTVVKRIRLEVRFPDSDKLVEEVLNEQVMVDVVELIGVEQRQLAVKLRDEGKVQEAKQVLGRNNLYLQQNAELYKSEKLQKFYFDNDENYENVEKDKKRKRQRKVNIEGDVLRIKQ